MCVCAICVLYRASYISLIIYVPILILVTVIGLAIHASYADCDPLLSGTITSGDQVRCYTRVKFT